MRAGGRPFDDTTSQQMPGGARSSRGQQSRLQANAAKADGSSTDRGFEIYSAYGYSAPLAPSGPKRLGHAATPRPRPKPTFLPTSVQEEELRAEFSRKVADLETTVAMQSRSGALQSRQRAMLSDELRKASRRVSPLEAPSQPDKIAPLKSRIHGMEQREIVYQSQIATLSEFNARESKAKVHASSKAEMMEAQLGVQHQMFQDSLVSKGELSGENQLLRRKMDRLENDANTMKRGYILSNSGMAADGDKQAGFHELQQQEFVKQINALNHDNEAQAQTIKQLRAELIKVKPDGGGSGGGPAGSCPIHGGGGGMDARPSSGLSPVAAKLSAQQQTSSYVESDYNSANSVTSVVIQISPWDSVGRTPAEQLVDCEAKLKSEIARVAVLDKQRSALELKLERSNHEIAAKEDRISILEERVNGDGANAVVSGNVTDSKLLQLESTVQINNLLSDERDELKVDLADKVTEYDSMVAEYERKLAQLQRNMDRQTAEHQSLDKDYQSLRKVEASRVDNHDQVLRQVTFGGNLSLQHDNSSTR